MFVFGAQSLGDHLSFFFLFATLGLAFNFIAYKKGFFTLPTSFDSRRWLLKDTVICLAIYLTIAFFITPFLGHLFVAKLSHKISLEELTVLLHVINIMLNVVCLGLYLLFSKKVKAVAIWKDHSMRSQTSIPGDIILGALTYFMAFPVVVIIHQLCTLINEKVFHIKEIDQVAVRYLKNATDNPFAFVIALFSIIIAAPFIEEFIFRGCIQNTIRYYLNSKWSIVLSSIIFASFHFSISQGASNFPLLTSLFFFALYLGFLYEKRRSLFANIALHMTFNTISVIRILV